MLADLFVLFVGFLYSLFNFLYRFLKFWLKLLGPNLLLCILSLFFLFHYLPSFSEPTSQTEVVVQEIRAGGQTNDTPRLRMSPPQPEVRSKPPVPKPEIQGGATEKNVRFRKPSGNPGGNGGNGGDPYFDENINTKKWENWVCPNPDEVISQPDFWNYLSEDPETCTDDENCELEEFEEFEIEEENQEIPRRKLLQVGPTSASTGENPTPTGKLDSQNLEKYDLTNKKMKPIVFPSREGIELSMDHRSLRKVVYSHPLELGLSDLGNRVPCPIQTDPTKYQRKDCWAITDVNIREAIVKIFEFTTFNNPQIITLERFPRDCSTQLGTFFIDTNTGNAVYFRKGGKQNGKLWSLDNFERDEITKMLQDPKIKKITDVSKMDLSKFKSKFKSDDL